MNAYKRIQISPIDFLIVLVGLIFVGLGSYVLSLDIGIESLSNAEKFGVVSSGNGTRKFDSSLQFFDINQNADLYYGDVIFANEDKAIDIAIDGDKDSIFTVPKDSMVKITKDGDEFNLDVAKGSVLVKTKKIKRIKVKDKRGKVRRLQISKSSQVKISAKKSNVIIEAVKGKAKLIANNAPPLKTVTQPPKQARPTTVSPPREGAKDNSKNLEVKQIDAPEAKDLADVKNKLEVSSEKLLVVGPEEAKVIDKIKLLSQTSIDPLYANKMQLALEFRNLKEVEVGLDSEFKKTQKLPVENGYIDISALSQGIYFLRKDKKSGYNEFSLKNTSPIKLQMEEVREKYYEGDKISIRWNGRPELMYRVNIKGPKNLTKLVQGNDFSYELEEAGEFSFQLVEQKFNRESNIIKRTFNFSKTLDSVAFVGQDDVYSNDKAINVKNPKKVKYGIKLINSKGKVAFNKITNAETVKIPDLKPGEYKLNLTNLKNNNSFFERDFKVGDHIKVKSTKDVIVSDKKNIEANVRWTRVGGYPYDLEYKVNFYDSEDAEEPFLSETTRSRSFKYKTGQEKEVFWEITSNHPDIVKKTPRQKLQLKRPEIETLKAKKIILLYLDDKDCYQFKVPEIKYATDYEVHIYSSRIKVKGGDWKIMYRKTLPENMGCIGSTGEGKYFYKYRVIDKWKRKSKFSPMGEIYFPISPLDDF